VRLFQTNPALQGDLAESLAQLDQKFANIVTPILGYASLYDSTAVSAQLHRLFRPFILPAFLTLIGLSTLGFWRRLPGAARGWAVVPLALSAVSIVAASTANYAVMIRGSQWAMPHVFAGLSLLAFAPGIAALRKRNRPRLASAAAVRPVLAGMVWWALLGLNGYAVARTIAHINSHSAATDLALHHFNPATKRWRELRQLVGADTHSPVLISGFADTPTPHMIGHGLDQVPNFLGQTITRFWHGADPVQVYDDWAERTPSSYGALPRLMTGEQMAERLKADPIWDWAATYARFLSESQFAILPVSGAYPAEWGERPSLLGPRGWRFPNLCDVVRRDEPAFTAEAEGHSAERDELGPFWRLDDAVRLHPRLTEPVKSVVELRYSGPEPHILLDGVETLSQPRSAPRAKIVTVAVELLANSGSMIEVQASPDTRLRSIDLYQLSER
jgi:hypothetical protein